MIDRKDFGAAALLTFLLGLLAPSAAAAVPDGIDYQGYLTNADGSVVDASISMSFVAYNVDFGGAPLWNQTATVPVEQGLFSVTLATPANPFPAGLFDGPVYIGLFIAGEELLPRRMLSSAGYAFKASDADSLGGSAPAAFDQSSHVSNMSNPHGVTAAQAGAASVAALTGLTGSVTALGQDVAVIDGEVSNNAAAIAALLASVNALQATVAGLQSDLSSANATIASLQSDVAAIQGNSVLALDGLLTLNGGDTALFTGVDVQVINGTGGTDGTPNGKGNIIVGYNQENAFGDLICSLGQYSDATNCVSFGGVWARSHKSGSHNVVIGNQNNYSRTSGLVVGYSNSITGELSSVTGGRENIAGGFASSISGGRHNIASGIYSSVSGGGGSDVGGGNIASGGYSSVSAGATNEASQDFSSVSGGHLNRASGAYSSVSGGMRNVASGSRASVSGGGGINPNQGNNASGPYSSISGGVAGVATGEGASVAGGLRNGANAR